MQRERMSNATPTSQVNWRRVFAVSSLIFALLLISGSIYLHIRQKHHLGRLHHEQRTVPSMGVAATPLTQEQHTANNQSDEIAALLFGNSDYLAQDTDADTSSTDDAAAASVSSLSSSSSSSSLSLFSLESMDSNLSAESESKELEMRYVSEACLQCICETATGCQPVTCSANVDCGVFRISQPYWLDAGKPQLEGDKSNNNQDLGYSHCVNNVYCAGRAVAAYIKKYSRDCNHDGIIDCRDYVALHLLGPSGCLQYELQPLFETRMESCLVNFE